MSLIVDYIGGGSSSISLTVGLNILSKPSKLFYIEGEYLNLDGLVVQFRNGATTTIIDGYTAIPANNTKLTKSDKFIKISYNIPETNDVLTEVIPIEVIYPVALNVEVVQKDILQRSDDPIDLNEAVLSLSYNNGYKEFFHGVGGNNGITAEPANGDTINLGKLYIEFTCVKNNETFKAYKGIKLANHTG
jgi:hypothetical protein